MRFIQILKRMGFTKALPLNEAFEIFQNEIGVMDTKSLRAYFGTRSGKSKRTISMWKRYQNGEQKFRVIELSCDIREKRGYLEILGLAHFEKKGDTVFMVLKNDFVVSLWSPQHTESDNGFDVRKGVNHEPLSKVEISLSLN